jgi:hypothetical protein
MTSLQLSYIFDASNVAAAACTVEIDRKNFHKMWTTDEEIEKIDVAIACKFSFILPASTIFTQFWLSVYQFKRFHEKTC